MKVFISGNYNGSTEVFEEAECCLKELRHDPVNPFKINCHQLVSWTTRLEILTGCDAIYLVEGWSGNNEATVEKYLCTVSGKEILFESRLKADQNRGIKNELSAVQIESAIHEVTGLKLAEYQEGSRKVNGYFARMIFSKQCNNAGIDSKEILHYIPGRDWTTILRYLKKYDDEFKFNKEFRTLAEKVDRKLNPEISHLVED